MENESVSYIITAKHYSTAEGADGTVRHRILKMRDDIKKKRNITLQIHGIDDPGGEAVFARIWQGQWIADCVCNGAQFVDPNEPIFFCFSCGNRSNGGRVRPVSFPPTEERIEIERLLLERPVNDMAGLTDLERAGMAQPLITVVIKNKDKSVEIKQLGRDWVPGESVADIAEQNKPVHAWHNLSDEEKRRRVLIGEKGITDEKGKSLFKFPKKKKKGGE